MLEENFIESKSNSASNIYFTDDNDKEEIERVSKSINIKRVLRNDVASQNSKNYLIGWAVYRSLKKFNCELCEKNLVDDSILYAPENSLIEFKSYKPGALKCPSLEMSTNGSTYIEIFNKLFEKNLIRRGLKQYIIQVCISHTNSINRSWFTGPCENHRKFILELIITLLLHKCCRTLVESSKKNIEKLKTLNKSKI